MALESPARKLAELGETLTLIKKRTVLPHPQTPATRIVATRACFTEPRSLDLMACSFWLRACSWTHPLLARIPPVDRYQPYACGTNTRPSPKHVWLEVGGALGQLQTRSAGMEARMGRFALLTWKRAKHWRIRSTGNRNMLSSHSDRSHGGGLMLRIPASEAANHDIGCDLWAAEALRATSKNPFRRASFSRDSKRFRPAARVDFISISPSASCASN
jgi:hypothetical protein